MNRSHPWSLISVTWMCARYWTTGDKEAEDRSDLPSCPLSFREEFFSETGLPVFSFLGTLGAEEGFKVPVFSRVPKNSSFASGAGPLKPVGLVAVTGLVGAVNFALQPGGGKREKGEKEASCALCLSSTSRQQPSQMHGLGMEVTGKSWSPYTRRSSLRRR